MKNMSLNSKKGSTAVFLIMILSAIILAISVMIYGASQLAGMSASDAVLELAGRSVLSEYDTELLKRYGIFAVNLDEAQIKDKISLYANYSFHNNLIKEQMYRKKHMNLLKLKMESIHVNLKGYSITDISIFEEQLLESAKYDLIKNITGGSSEAVPSKQSDIELKNSQVINSLPSCGYERPALDIGQLLQNGIPGIDELRGKSIDNFSINEYIMGHFINHRRGTEERVTFFQNEAEYILNGGFSDQKNYKAVRKNLFIIRTGMNLTHIYSDSEKRNEIAALAEVLTPGPPAVLTQAVIAGIWSAAEAENDMKRLEDGKKVPLVKTKQQWALHLENAVQADEKHEIETLKDSLEENGEEENLDLGKSIQAKRKKTGYIEPRDKRGIEYEDYLRILLFMENREMKLLRCMDLIQLNMKGSYHQDFDIRQFYGGFEFDAVIQEKKLSYVQKY